MYVKHIQRLSSILSPFCLPSTMSGGFLRDKLWIRLIPSSYTPAQVLAYLEKIGWDAGLSEDDIQAKRFPRGPDALAKLILLHLLTFPWDNTAMH